MHVGMRRLDGKRALVKLCDLPLETCCEPKREN